jgi:hypothetical protein
MKTSNKILSLFLLFILLVPILSLMALSSKIKDGEYTVVKLNEGRSGVHQGTFANFKTIKIVAPSPIMSCQIVASDTSFYSYINYSDNDSIRIYNVGDTLYVQYVLGTESQPEQGQKAGINLRLNVPYVSNLVVVNAEVSMFSKDSLLNGDLVAEVYDMGKLNFGNISYHVNEDEREQSTYHAGNVSISTIKGEVYFSNHVNIGKLNLYTQGATKLGIEDNARIGSIEGRVSDSTKIDAEWKNIKALTR